MSEVKSFFLMGCMVITGALNTIFLSLQFSESALGQKYNHPWFQTQNMFLGEFYCLIFYYVTKYLNSRKQDKDQDTSEAEETSPSVFLLAVPAACDFFASTLLAFALLNMATSVYQMLRGGLVLVTALLSVIFLGRKQYRHHILGLVLVFVSIFTLGLAGMLYKDSKEGQRETNFLGILMMGLSLLFTGIQFILEELFLSQYTVNPLKIVGLEGMWGIIYYTITLFILQDIRCDSFFGRSSVCTINDKGEWRAEDTIFALKQMMNNGLLFALVIAATFSVACYNYFGVSVTKHASSAQRAVVDNLRTILIWMFFILVPTKISEKFIWLQFVGFIGLVIGTLIYNEVITVPYCDFDKYTKDKLALNEEERDIVSNYDKIVIRHKGSGYDTIPSTIDTPEK